jgi:hypothetical protein
MEEIGTIMTTKQINKKYGIQYAGRARMIFSACPICKEPRWIKIKDDGKICNTCRGKSARNWPQNIGIQILSIKEFKILFPNSKSHHAHIQYKCPSCNENKWVGLYSYRDGQICNKCSLEEKRPKDNMGVKNKKWKC